MKTGASRDFGIYANQVSANQSRGRALAAPTVGLAASAPGLDRAPIHSAPSTGMPG